MAQRVILTVMSGAEDGKVFELHTFPVMIGRHAEDDVFLPDDLRVSRHHARITKDQEAFYIEDIGVIGEGSTNGTYLNGLRINDETFISNGDMMLLGTVWLRFETS